MQLFSIANSPGGLNKVEIIGEKPQSKPDVLFLGGWDQNPDLLCEFLKKLDNFGKTSVGFSAFDTIDPLTEATEKGHSIDDLWKSYASADAVGPIEFFGGLDIDFASFPPRMVERAFVLRNICRLILGHVLWEDEGLPDITVTHCAGANVYMLAKLFELYGVVPANLLPDTAVMLEPMIMEHDSFRPVTTAFARHEKATRDDDTFISLKAMRHPNAGDPGTKAAKPLEDIVRSAGLHLLKSFYDQDLNPIVVLGENDIAAPLSDLSPKINSMAVDAEILMWPNQKRTGHGYPFAEPEAAAEFTASLLQKAVRV